MSDRGSSMSNLKGSIYDFSDQSRHGPGFWVALLMFSAASSESGRECREHLVYMIKYASEYYQCKRCRTHFQDYISNNDPVRVLDTPDGLFYWVVDFMNAVDRRVSKERGRKPKNYDPLILHDIFFTDPEFSIVCDKGCGGGELESNNEPVKSQSRSYDRGEYTNRNYRTPSKRHELITDAGGKTYQPYGLHKHNVSSNATEFISISIPRDTPKSVIYNLGARTVEPPGMRLYGRGVNPR